MCIRDSQHPAPQPGRGDRRDHAPDRPPRGDAGRPDELREGPRLPDRGAYPRPPGDHRRLPDRARLDPDAGGGRDRGGPVSYTHLDVYKRQDYARAGR